mgnify:CR=1 FL=1
MKLGRSFAALAALAQVLGQVPGRTQPVNAGADDDVLRMGRESHEGNPQSVVVAAQPDLAKTGTLA